MILNTPINGLHKGMMSAIEQAPYRAFVSLMAKKLADQGVQLTEKQQRALIRRFQAGKNTGRRFRFGRRKPGEKSVHLQFSKDELALFTRAVKRTFAQFPKMFRESIDELAPRISADLDQRWPVRRRFEERQMREFRRQLLDRWDSPISRLEQLLVIVQDLGAAVNAEIRAEAGSKRPFTIEVQTRFHARACLTTREIITLLRNGFADGALARWRSLHELTVVSIFIGADEELAERFRLYEAVESWKSAKRHNEHATRLHERPIPPKTMEAMQAGVDALKRRFGPEYARDYGWAAARLDDRQPTFEKVERAIKLGHFRPQYRLASNSVHAGPKGSFFKLGLMSQDEVLLAGPSSFGLADAGQSTAISLYQITATLVSLHPIIDILVGARIVGAVSADAGNLFVDTQRALAVEARDHSRAAGSALRAATRRP